MDETQIPRDIFSKPPKPERPSRRERRAARTRAQALSFRRLLGLVLSFPLIMGGTALGVYLRTSPYETEAAARHLVALAGCDAAASVGLAPAYVGDPGYHKRNDPTGSGIACAGAQGHLALTAAPVAQPPDPKERRVGGAKFIKP